MSSVREVDRQMIDWDEMLAILKANLQRVQQCMVSIANKKRGQMGYVVND